MMGMVGKEILLDFMREAGQDISSIHMDCGIEMFDPRRRIPFGRERLWLLGGGAVRLYSSENTGGEWNASCLCRPGRCCPDQL